MGFSLGLGLGLGLGLRVEFEFGVGFGVEFGIGPKLNPDKFEWVCAGQSDLGIQWEKGVHDTSTLCVSCVMYIG